MQGQITLFASLLLVTACSDAPSATDTPTNDSRADLAHMVSRLHGAWSDTTADGRTIFHEHWSRTGDAEHTGLGFVMSGADTVFIEHLGIHWDSTGAWYSARIPSQNNGDPVPFKLAYASDDSLVFTNPEHDFPQRIRYAWTAGNAWDVVVSGMVRDTLRSEHFLLRQSRTSHGADAP